MTMEHYAYDTTVQFCPHNKNNAHHGDILQTRIFPASKPRSNSYIFSTLFYV